MVNQVKKDTSLSAKNWLPIHTLFERCADELDESDFQSNDPVGKR